MENKTATAQVFSDMRQAANPCTNCHSCPWFDSTILQYLHPNFSSRSCKFNPFRVHNFGEKQSNYVFMSAWLSICINTGYCISTLWHIGTINYRNGLQMQRGKIKHEILFILVLRAELQSDDTSYRHPFLILSSMRQVQIVIRTKMRWQTACNMVTVGTIIF